MGSKSVSNNGNSINDFFYIFLRPPRGVYGAHLHQAYRPYVIGVMASQTHGNVRSWSAYVCIREQLSLISSIGAACQYPTEKSLAQFWCL